MKKQPKDEISNSDFIKEIATDMVGGIAFSDEAKHQVPMAIALPVFIVGLGIIGFLIYVLFDVAIGILTR